MSECFHEKLEYLLDSLQFLPVSLPLLFYLLDDFLGIFGNTLVLAGFLVQQFYVQSLILVGLLLFDELYFVAFLFILVFVYYASDFVDFVFLLVYLVAHELA